MNTPNTENVKLHKENFTKYLTTIKKNSKVISIDDVNEIKQYLIAKLRGETVAISPKLKKRIKRYNLVLVQFPSAEYVLCVCDKKVSYC